MKISPSGLKRLPSRATLLGLIGASALWGCAPLPPLPFSLIDRGQVYQGTMLQSDRRIDVDIGAKHFRGYYLLAQGTAYFSGIGWRRTYGYDNRTNFISNTARASLSSADGEWLNCEFIVDDGQAIGECKSTNGQSYQLVTQIR